MISRRAAPADAAAIADIYNEGIEDGIATFETRPRTADEVRKWFGTRFPIVVVENSNGQVIAFASTSEYRPRECYAGVAEFSVYVARSDRGRGVGRLAMQLLMDDAASRGLLTQLGFREVGIYKRHAQSRGIWRDVVIVEALLTES